jgi:hypothetical protein
VDKALRRIMVAQGLLEPQEGDPPPQPAPQPPPDPRVMAQVQKLNADAERSHAQAQKTMAETALLDPKAQSEIDKTNAQTYESQAYANAQHMANIDRIHMAQGGVPPPDPSTIDQAQTQPPQGGFSLPDSGQPQGF